ncbi:MAG: rRNA pseudouridine synthase [Clostridiaceae bacterium]|jgi:23S rRNA pseudouridine2604 synthase|nr:rRNA pseudouridine synthase [Clostridiaceae bacterium]
MDKSKINNSSLNIEHRDDSIRINKFISDSGLCSRREADKFISSGRVSVNNKPAEIGTKVYPGDLVTLDGKQLKATEELVYIALNKPVGITCTTERKVNGNIIDYINHPQRIFPIGRLDKDSQGLILLTNDGNIVNKILRAGNNHEKEYIVTVDKPITKEFISKMSSGVNILNTKTKPCKIVKLSNYTFNIILTQGLNRQVRRMCQSFDYSVIKLKRIRIMNIRLGDLLIGKWRYLTKSELQGLNNLISNSSKTEEASR